jgi:hypothetical protein
MFTACGGGGENSTSTGKYDMWDYIASKTSKTVLLDLYNSNSKYTSTTNRRANVGYIEYTISSNTKKFVDFDGEASATFVLNGNSLTIANTEVGRYKDIGSKLGSCILTKHHDNITIDQRYTFSDVLEFDCTDYKEFYAKDKGNVINHTKSTFINGNNRTVRYGISVANNW